MKMITIVLKRLQIHISSSLYQWSLENSARVLFSFSSSERASLLIKSLELSVKTGVKYYSMTFDSKYFNV